jgi:type II secretory pathway pseudopilin PulG
MPAWQSSITPMYALPQIKLDIRRFKPDPSLPLAGRAREGVFATGPDEITSSRIRRALSLIEVVASTLIVGVMAVAALNSLGAATRSSESIGNRAVAIGLGDELMAEILQAEYSEPSGAASLGPDGGELGGPRSAFDDVDDYDGWNRSPPQYLDGTPMLDRDDWRHRVEVDYVLPDDSTQTAGSDQGAKRIHVFIEYRDKVLGDKVLVEQIAVRTNATEQ